MAESIVQVTEGSGKKLHTNSYTVGANTVEDEAVFLGPYPYATYTALATGASGATANDHLLTLNAGASLKVRVHRIVIMQSAVATAVAIRAYSVLRTTTGAPTGGTAITPNPFDTSDGASGATSRQVPAVKGTEAAILLQPIIVAAQAVAATGAQAWDRWEWKQHPGAKPIIIPAGTTNGLAVKNMSATAASTWTVLMEFTETAF
jgi:hypothetical protein